ncbi:hypothetical protein MIND_01138000 [Mycena indigotica]|uniref:Tc1-like transposase DDE domain-containing protein n=1 Tax=Mycena indigotica TaxID=2126181 RepID=A0A8H6S958_9AGAR|nr:uncharacterized protein MIND_01138000 [Mycena indigotica]KAF7293590.1 hypothetical protein MIND_01138000 [Mycena indigotica]
MRPGKNKDGYFTGVEVEDQATAACSIVVNNWPDFEHIFVYDNASTHHKRSEAALTARGMPQKISGFVSEATKKRKADMAAKQATAAEDLNEMEVDEPGLPAPAPEVGEKKKRKPRKPPEESNFLVKVNARNLDGSVRFDEHGNPVKVEERMTGARFKDGTVQDLYLPDSHPEYAGKFKGMAMILEERRERGDLRDIAPSITKESLSKLRAECKSADGKAFKCSDPKSHTCCMRRMLFNQPDFAEVKSCLESTCLSFGVTVLFLPRFHPELNPIEMCWGYAKRVYRLKPESGREDDLEKNALEALDSVPLHSIRKFVQRCGRFADAYCKGLDGAQAAWACRKYKGHRGLPPEYLADLKAAGIRAGGNPEA